MPLDALTVQDVLAGPAMASGSARRPGGIDRREFGGQPSGHLGQQQFPDRGLWVGLAQHNDQRTRRQENHDRVSLNHERTPTTGVPQLTGYLTRDFFKGK